MTAYSHKSAFWSISTIKLLNINASVGETTKDNAAEAADESISAEGSKKNSLTRRSL